MTKGPDLPSLDALFEAETDRLARLTFDCAGIHFDWSKTHLDTAHLAGFAALAEAADFAGRRSALFAGEPVNATEGRSAEHTAQRGVGRAQSVQEAASLHARMHMQGKYFLRRRIL